MNFISEIIDHESNYKKVLSAIIKYLKLKVPIQILSLPSWTTADVEMWACAAVSNTWHAQVEQYLEYCGNAQIAKTTINKPKSPWQLRSVLNVICTNNKDDNNKSAKGQTISSGYLVCRVVAYLYQKGLLAKKWKN